MSKRRRIVVKTPVIDETKYTDIYDDIKRADLENTTIREEIDGWVVSTIPANSDIYRGVNYDDYRHENYLDSEEGFIYFGNFDIGANYAFSSDMVRHAGKIVKFKTKRIIRVLDLSVVENFDKLFEDIKDDPDFNDMKKLFKDAFGYSPGNKNIKRISVTTHDYPLSLLLCKYFYKKGLDLHGFGYNSIEGFHMEYMICTKNITSYIKLTDIEYRWLSFYRPDFIFNKKKKSVEINTRKDYLFETKEGLLTKNVIENSKPTYYIGKTAKKVDYLKHYNFPSITTHYTKWDRFLFQQPFYSLLLKNLFIDYPAKKAKIFDDMEKVRQSMELPQSSTAPQKRRAKAARTKKAPKSVHTPPREPSAVLKEQEIKQSPDVFSLPPGKKRCPPGSNFDKKINMCRKNTQKKK